MPPSRPSPPGPERWSVTRTAPPPPTSTTLRAVGFDEGQIFAITTFIALRLAFSTVNDALGAQPDAVLAAAVPPEVHAAVTFGRPADD